MHDVMGFGILYGWQVHWTAQLPVLLAVTAIMFLAGASSTSAPPRSACATGGGPDRHGAG